MNKHASLAAAVAIVLLANAFALVHAARNRSGEVQADITLTDRELNYYRDYEDSGVALTLRWIDPSQTYAPVATPEDIAANTWLNQTNLRELGFDCSVAPSDTNAYTFYSQQSARTGYVAFEYEGDAWKRWLEFRRRIADAEPRLPGQRSTDVSDQRWGSRLVAIDAAADPASLRARHPDRNRILILPAVIRISVAGPWTGTDRRQIPPYLKGFIQEVPSVIHVSKPFSDVFRNQTQTSRDDKREDALYTVRLLYGRFLEPWVTAVNFSAR
jgi:hypothetical protein